MNAVETLSAEELILARATKAAIEATGGGKVCLHVTRIQSEAQLSRCASRNNPDSITIRDAAAIESISHGRAGHPHITRALARLAGGVFVPLPEADEAGDGLLASVVTLVEELGDVSQAIRAGLADNDFSRGDATLAIDQLDELDQASAALRMKLCAIVDEDRPGRRPAP